MPPVKRNYFRFSSSLCPNVFRVSLGKILTRPWNEKDFKISDKAMPPRSHSILPVDDFIKRDLPEDRCRNGTYYDLKISRHCLSVGVTPMLIGTNKAVQWVVVGTHLMKWATYQVEYNRVDTINNHELFSCFWISSEDNYITLDVKRSEGGHG